METNIEVVLDLFKEGKKIREISEITGIKYKTVSAIRIRNLDLVPDYEKQLPTRKTFIDENFFDEINSEEKAYMLGYFIGDGNIEEKKCRFGLAVAIDDLEAVLLFQKYISPDVNIIERVRFRNGNQCKTQICFRWTSKHMARIFKDKYNILPRKTYHSDFTFPFETIPTDLHRHFIRGLIDADGHIGLKENAIGIYLIVNSEEFLNQLSEILYLSIPLIKIKTNAIIGINAKYYRMHLRTSSGTPGQACKCYNAIYRYLYDNSHFFLSRKYKKFNYYFLNTEVNKLNKKNLSP